MTKELISDTGQEDRLIEYYIINPQEKEKDDRRNNTNIDRSSSNIHY